MTVAIDRYLGKVQNPRRNAMERLNPEAPAERPNGQHSHWRNGIAARAAQRRCDPTGLTQACAALAFCTRTVKRRAKSAGSSSGLPSAMSAWS
jgi:hypothetical protein